MRGGTKIPNTGTEADEATLARGGGTRFPDYEGDTEVDCTEGKDVMSAPEREAGGMNVPDRESAAGADTIGTPTRAADNGITPNIKSKQNHHKNPSHAPQTTRSIHLPTPGRATCTGLNWGANPVIHGKKPRREQNKEAPECPQLNTQPRRTAKITTQAQSATVQQAPQTPQTAPKGRHA